MEKQNPLATSIVLDEKKTEKGRFVRSLVEWRDFGRTEDRLSEQGRDWRSSLRRSAAVLQVSQSSRLELDPPRPIAVDGSYKSSKTIYAPKIVRIWQRTVRRRQGDQL